VGKINLVNMYYSQLKLSILDVCIITFFFIFSMLKSVNNILYIYTKYNNVLNIRYFDKFDNNSWPCNIIE